MPNEVIAKSRPTALVTGGNTGIGFETCKALLNEGFHVIVGARSREKAERAVDDLLRGAPASSSAEPIVVDLGSLRSVRNAANAFIEKGRPLNICVLNAGVMALPWDRTSDGFEQQWQVNVLGHFLFCRLLLPAILAAELPAGRVVWVASGAHRLHSEAIDYGALAREHESDEEYDQWRAYGRSKLANILLSNELARSLRNIGALATSNALHPGNVNTALWAKAGRSNDTGISVEEGAQTSIYLATSNKAEGLTGGYYFQCKPVTTIYNESSHKDADYIAKSAMRSEVSLSEAEARLLWSIASDNVGLNNEL